MYSHSYSILERANLFGGTARAMDVQIESPIARGKQAHEMHALINRSLAQQSARSDDAVAPLWKRTCSIHVVTVICA